MIRAFLALELPDAQRAALRLQQFLLPLPGKVEPESFHLTLLFLGEQPVAVLEALHDRLCDLRLHPFALTLQGLGLFGGAKARVAWAGVAPCEALDQLQAKCANAAALAGVRFQARKFMPHVTLGRFPPPDPIDQLRLERGIAEGAGFRSGPFTVSELVMYESQLGPKGARYTVLARYPLAR